MASGDRAYHIAYEVSGGSEYGGDEDWCFWEELKVFGERNINMGMEHSALLIVLILPMPFV